MLGKLDNCVASAAWDEGCEERIQFINTVSEMVPMGIRLKTDKSEETFPGDEHIRNFMLSYVLGDPKIHPVLVPDIEKTRWLMFGNAVEEGLKRQVDAEFAQLNVRPEIMETACLAISKTDTAKIKFKDEEMFHSLEGTA